MSMIPRFKVGAGPEGSIMTPNSSIHRPEFAVVLRTSQYLTPTAKELNIEVKSPDD